MQMASSSSASASASSLVLSFNKRAKTTTTITLSSSLLHSSVSQPKKIWTVRALSLSSPPSLTTAAPPPPVNQLVTSILSKVRGTDRGVLLEKEGHKEVADVAQQLSNYCVDQPVNSTLIFGEWDVQYCSVPTSPGGGYRSAIGRLIFKTNEMLQVVESPNIVRNIVSFSAFGFIDGQVSLKGKLKALDEKWIQVIFEPPQLKIGSLGFQYGGESEVKLEITYIDEKIRLGKGSRGSLFVFVRKDD